MSRDNSGTLSRNTRKEKANQPDSKGSATIDGVEYWISGWWKENDRGKFASLSFTRKDNQPARDAKPTSQSSEDDTDIPF